MGNEFVFRIILLILFISFVAHRGYYHRKFSRPDDSTIKQREEKILPKLANLLSIPGLIAVIVYIVYPSFISWSSLSLPTWLRWSGVGVALLGFFLLQWAHQVLGKNWSDTPRIVQEHTLVMSGPYRWIRHPIYAAFILILSSPLLISANWFIGIMWIGMTTLDVISRIRFEEEMMIAHFGDQYRAYMQGTGRLLPRLIRSNRDQKERR